MNSKTLVCLLGIAAFLSLSSCSGPKSACTVNCGGGGNAKVNVSISDSTPSGASILSFTMPIIGITLTPSSGSPVSLFSSSTAANIELTRLQSDSDLIATNVSVAAGTYTAVNVTVTAPSGVFANTSGAAIGSCAAGSTATPTICHLSNGAAGTITFTFPTSSKLVLSGNQNAWIDLDFNYNNAVTSTGGIDVTQSNVLSILTTPPTGVQSGAFANVDDFTGAVQAITATTITVESNVRGSITATISSSTPVTDPQGLCSKASLSSGVGCVQVGAIVSLQALLTNTGGITVSNIDIIDTQASASDEVEGFIYPSTCNGGNNFGMVLSDSAIGSSSSPLVSSPAGTFLCLTLSSTAPFAIDYGVLTNQGAPISGFSGTGDVRIGQTVRAKITGAATGSSGVINATATSFLLRFSRITATVNNVASNNFTVTSFPPYLNITGTPAVYVYPNAPTLFEGVSNISGLASGNTVSFSALYLNNTTQTFNAQKVRLH